MPNEFERVKGLICGKCGLVCVKLRADGPLHPEIKNLLMEAQAEAERYKTAHRRVAGELADALLQIAALRRTVDELNKYPVLRVDDQRQGQGRGW
jgi:hypothetical protein